MSKALVCEILEVRSLADGEPVQTMDQGSVTPVDNETISVDSNALDFILYQMDNYPAYFDTFPGMPNGMDAFVAVDPVPAPFPNDPFD